MYHSLTLILLSNVLVAILHDAKFYQLFTQSFVENATAHVNICVKSTRVFLMK